QLAVPARMTKPDPGAICGSSAPPPVVTSFSTADPAAYLWFQINNGATGDRFAVQFYTPANKAYGNLIVFDPLTASGQWCLTATLNIANTSAALQPGTWSLEVSYNDTTFFTLTFTIQGASSGCTYSINPTSQAVTSPGGNFQVAVAAGAGCAWTAL